MAQNIIGPYTKREKAEKGNGEKLSKICHGENMIPMTTWKQSPLTKEEKKKYKITPTPHNTGKQLTRLNSTHGQAQTDKHKDKLIT